MSKVYDRGGPRPAVLRPAPRPGESRSSAPGRRQGAPLTPTGVLELQRTEGNRAVVRRLAEPNSVQRDKSAPGTTTADAAVPPVQYEVGGVKYPEDGFSAAVGQIGDLWTASNGILAKQKEAVAEFCGTGGAAATDEGSLTDALLTAALMSLLTVATDGLGTAVAGTLMKVVTVAAKHVAVDPEVVLKMGEKVVEKVVDVGKDKAKEAVTGAVTASHTKTPTGGTKLATPLATYQSALDAVLDADASAMKQKTLNEVLQLPSTPPAASHSGQAIWWLWWRTRRRRGSVSTTSRSRPPRWAAPPPPPPAVAGTPKKGVRGLPRVRGCSRSAEGGTSGMSAGGSTPRRRRWTESGRIRRRDRGRCRPGPGVPTAGRSRDPDETVDGWCPTGGVTARPGGTSGSAPPGGSRPVSPCPVPGTTGRSRSLSVRSRPSGRGRCRVRPGRPARPPDRPSGRAPGRSPGRGRSGTATARPGTRAPTRSTTAGCAGRT